MAVLMENNEGSLIDWITITPESVGRIVGFTDACGVPRPRGEDVEDASKGKLAQAYCDRLVGRRVQAFVAERPDRVTGYRAVGPNAPAAG